MKAWLKYGMILGIVGGVGYILLNLLFLLLGPEYQELVNLNLIKNIFPFIIWIVVGFVVGLILGLIIGSIKKGKNKKGQVWVETVIYTLIGLAIIGIIIGVATPQINSYRDKILIDQTIDMMNLIDSKINEVKFVAGNSRPLKISIKKGKLILDASNEKIMYELGESRKVYSEPGQEVNIGNVKVLTETNGETKITLILDYSDTNLDIKYQEKDISYELQPAPQPYNLAVRNNGVGDDGKTKINFQ